MELRIAELEKKLLEMSETFSSQAAVIASQALRIKELESQLSQKAVRTTSKNSHLPPSKDLTRSSKKEVKPNQSLREKSGKPVGGQKGHKGHSLKMTENPACD